VYNYVFFGVWGKNLVEGVRSKKRYLHREEEYD
jgi:hypothetical protein